MRWRGLYGGLFLLGALALGQSAIAAGLTNPGQPFLARPATPAFAGDAPDPDVLVAAGRYFAYTTGTTWGNNLGVLTSSRPVGNWRTRSGKSYGSSALPAPPAWQVAGQQTSPSVARIGGRYLMYYDARLAADPSLFCLSVAISSSPGGPFEDHSTHHLGPCAASFKGSVDPDVIALGRGRFELSWKENDSGPYGSAQIVAETLSRDGLRLVGSRHVLLTQDSARYRWETTTENPALVHAGGHWWLFFSAGSWTNSTYSEAVASCSGPLGPCRGTPRRLLTSYGRVHGPGGGSLFETPSGSWYMDFAAWTGACGHEAPGCGRQLYIAPLEFGPLEITTGSLPRATAGESYRARLVAVGGLGPRSWTASGLPAGLSISPSTGVIHGTPRTTGRARIAVEVTTTAGKREVARRELSLDTTS